MNPGISIRFGTLELTNARRTWADNGDHSTYFLPFPTNQGK
jgi:hypothetical protein